MGRAARRKKERRIQKRREFHTTVENWTDYDLAAKRRNTEQPHGETLSARTGPRT